MPEVFQQPEKLRGMEPAAIVIDDNLVFRTDAATTQNIRQFGVGPERTTYRRMGIAE